MFRSMRRQKQQLSEEQCAAVLQAAPRGVLAVLGDDEYPYTVPINFFYDASAQKLYFHGAGTGHKADAIRRHDKVSFCTRDEGVRKDGDWAFSFQSVVVFGRMKTVEDPDEALEAARQIALKYYPDTASAEEEVQKTKGRVVIYALRIEHMTGKLVYEK